MRILAVLFACGTLLPASPTVTSVANAANYQPTIASATWISIFGTELSPSTNTWSDFSGGTLPVSLDGVQVTINSMPAYVAFVSPGQINALVPDDATVGQVAVIVTNALGSSAAYMADKERVAPALFVFAQDGGRYAITQDSPTYKLIAPPGLLGAAVDTAAAFPGEPLILYGTGLGLTKPLRDTGHLITSPAPVASEIALTIGGKAVSPQFAGLIGPGLYQINFAMPDIADGDATVVVAVDGVSAKSALIPVKRPALPAAGPNTPQLVGCVTGPVQSITYSVGRVPSNEPDDIIIGGTDLCAACTVKPPIYPEFADRMRLALERGKTIEACYDSHGVVYRVSLRQ